MAIGRIALGFVLGALALGAATGASLAATARASDPLVIYDGPGRDYLPIGRLDRGEVVSLSECTPSGRWCRIVHPGPDGWVLASFLIGSAAKVNATPVRPLVNPRFFFFPRHFHRGFFP